jgi:vacuolar-type H+-ATPase subunit E/Vma4
VPLDAVLNAIHQTTQKQITKLNLQTEAQIRVIQSKASSEIEEIRRIAVQEGKLRISNKKALLDQQKKLSSLQVLADARQKLIRQVLNNLKDQLVNFHDSPNYKSILSNLINQSILILTPSLLPNQKIHLLLDKRDAKIIPEQIKNDPLIEIKFNMDCWGGCIAQSEDGQVRVLNTLEDRLNRALPSLQIWLSIFFDQRCNL